MLVADSPGKTAEDVVLPGWLMPLTEASSSLIPPHPIRTGTDEVPVEFGSTVRSCEVVNILPVLSETASEIVYVPFVNDWDTGSPVLFVPPKFQLSAYGLVPPDAVSLPVSGQTVTFTDTASGGTSPYDWNTRATVLFVCCKLDLPVSGMVV